MCVCVCVYVCVCARTCACVYPCHSFRGNLATPTQLSGTSRLWSNNGNDDITMTTQ